MFEKGKPIPHGFRDDESHDDPLVGSVDSPPSRGREALRAIDLSELTARLSAARDLRRELRAETLLCAGASGASFGDAAAIFFRNLGDGERHVDPEDLEACKASCGRPDEITGSAATGDARDEV